MEKNLPISNKIKYIITLCPVILLGSYPKDTAAKTFRVTGNMIPRNIIFNSRRQEIKQISMN